MTSINKNKRDYMIRIYAGKLNLTVSAGGYTTQDIDHGLPYVPAFKVYARINNDKYRFLLPAILSTGSGTTYNSRLHSMSLNCEVINSVLRVEINSFDTAANTVHFDFFIYADRSGLL